jgi:putative ABC transport system ATP-binding protein
MKILIALNDAGTTIVMVTHSSENARLGNRVVNLLDGKIVSQTSAAPR